MAYHVLVGKVRAAMAEEAIAPPPMEPAAVKVRAVGAMSDDAGSASPTPDDGNLVLLKEHEQRRRSLRRALERADGVASAEAVQRLAIEEAWLTHTEAHGRTHTAALDRLQLWAHVVAHVALGPEAAARQRIVNEERHARTRRMLAASHDRRQHLLSGSGLSDPRSLGESPTYTAHSSASPGHSPLRLEGMVVVPPAAVPVARVKPLADAEGFWPDAKGGEASPSLGLAPSSRGSARGHRGSRGSSGSDRSTPDGRGRRTGSRGSARGDDDRKPPAAGSDRRSTSRTKPRPAREGRQGSQQHDSPRSPKRQASIGRMSPRSPPSRLAADAAAATAALPASITQQRRESRKKSGGPPPPGARKSDAGAGATKPDDKRRRTPLRGGRQEQPPQPTGKTSPPAADAARSRSSIPTTTPTRADSKRSVAKRRSRDAAPPAASPRQTAALRECGEAEAAARMSLLAAEVEQHHAVLASAVRRRQGVARKALEWARVKDIDAMHTQMLREGRDVAKAAAAKAAAAAEAAERERAARRERKRERGVSKEEEDAASPAKTPLPPQAARGEDAGGKGKRRTARTRSGDDEECMAALPSQQRGEGEGDAQSPVQAPPMVDGEAAEGDGGRRTRRAKKRSADASPTLEATATAARGAEGDGNAAQGDTQPSGSDTAEATMADDKNTPQKRKAERRKKQKGRDTAAAAAAGDEGAVVVANTAGGGDVPHALAGVATVESEEEPHVPDAGTSPAGGNEGGEKKARRRERKARQEKEREKPRTASDTEGTKPPLPAPAAGLPPKGGSPSADGDRRRRSKKEKQRLADAPPQGSALSVGDVLSSLSQLPTPGELPMLPGIGGQRGSLTGHPQLLPPVRTGSYTSPPSPPPPAPADDGKRRSSKKRKESGGKAKVDPPADPQEPPAIGTTIRVKNLKGKAEFNGRLGWIRRYHGADVCVNLEEHGRKEFLLKPHNYDVVPPAPEQQEPRALDRSRRSRSVTDPSLEHAAAEASLTRRSSGRVAPSAQNTTDGGSSGIASPTGAEPPPLSSLPFLKPTRLTSQGAV